MLDLIVFTHNRTLIVEPYNKQLSVPRMRCTTTVVRTLLDRTVRFEPHNLQFSSTRVKEHLPHLLGPLGHN